jgi:hypothetical protein
MFSLVGVLIALKQCRLQVENLDMIIVVLKIWPNHPHLNCIANSNFKDYAKLEVPLAKNKMRSLNNLNILKSCLFTMLR